MAVIALQLLAFLAPITIYWRHYKKVPPNMAMVVYGRRMMDGTGFQVVSGGGKFIVPIVESYAMMPLDVRELDIDLKDLVIDKAAQPKRVHLRAVASIKISSEPEVLRVAAEHLLGKPDAEVNHLAQSHIEASIRGICKDLTFKEVDADRDTWGERMARVVISDLRNMGIELRTFAIKDVTLLG